MLAKVMETVRAHAGKAGVIGGASAAALALSSCTAGDRILGVAETVGPAMIADIQLKNDLKLAATTASICGNSIGALQRLNDPGQQLELILICPGGEEMLRSILALLEEDRGFASQARLERLRTPSGDGD